MIRSDFWWSWEIRKQENHFRLSQFPRKRKIVLSSTFRTEIFVSVRLYLIQNGSEENEKKFPVYSYETFIPSSTRFKLWPHYIFFSSLLCERNLTAWLPRGSLSFLCPIRMCSNFHLSQHFSSWFLIFSFHILPILFLWL